MRSRTVALSNAMLCLMFAETLIMKDLPTLEGWAGLLSGVCLDLAASFHDSPDAYPVPKIADSLVGRLTDARAYIAEVLEGLPNSDWRVGTIRKMREDIYTNILYVELLPMLDTVEITT